MSKFGPLKDLKSGNAEPALPAAPPSPALPVAAPAPDQKPPATTGRGGKRDDPRFTKATTYLPVDVLHKVKGRLHEESLPRGRGRDLSELVGELLRAWLENPDA